MIEANNVVDQYKGAKVPSMDSINFSVDKGEFGFHDIFSCLSDEEQKIFGEHVDRIIIALHANVGDGDDEMFEKMKTLRARVDEMGVFFKDHGYDFLGGHSGFLGSHGFHDGKDEDE